MPSKRERCARVTLRTLEKAPDTERLARMESHSLAQVELAVSKVGRKVQREGISQGVGTVRIKL